MTARILNIDRSPRVQGAPPMIRVEVPSIGDDPPRVLGVCFKRYDYNPTKECEDGILLAPSRRATKCGIYEIKGEDATLIAEGTAKCSHLDNFHKETGRKFALKAALEDMGAGVELRSVVWTTYHGRRPDPIEPASTLAEIRKLVINHERGRMSAGMVAERDAIAYAEIKHLLGYGVGVRKEATS